MASKYEKVFSLQPRLYAEGSPVIIEAGALQKDTTNLKIIAQLKFRNITSKVIKALTVKIIPLDIMGNVLDNEIEFQYLDLNVSRDGMFGSKTPVLMPNNTTRAFKVYVSKVIFSDNSTLLLEECEWSNIPKQDKIKQKIIDLDSSVNNRFHKLIGFVGNNELLKYKDLWLCSCGEINKINEEKCHNCNISLNKLSDLDINKEIEYQYAKELLNSDLENDIKEALEHFNSIINYKDSIELINKCNQKISELKQKAEEKRIREEKLAEERRIIAEKEAKRDKKIKIIVAIVLCVAIIAGVAGYAISKSVKYNKATELLANEQYQEAYDAFNELSDYKDSSTQMLECKYQEALTLLSSKEYQDAYNEFNELGDYKDCSTQAKSLLEEHPALASVGDTISFGSYANEEIEWQVLAKEDDKVLVITKNIIECRPYNTEDEDVTWETCTLRKWLNEDFYNSTFSDNEKSLIQTTKVVNKDNSIYNTDGGNDTEDKVFLLSSDEVIKYFTGDSESKWCQGTSNAKANGLPEYKGHSPWWLRSPGIHQDYAEYSDYVCGDNSVDCNGNGVRPALWISFD